VISPGRPVWAIPPRPRAPSVCARPAGRSQARGYYLVEEAEPERPQLPGRHWGCLEGKAGTAGHPAALGGPTDRQGSLEVAGHEIGCVPEAPHGCEGPHQPAGGSPRSELSAMSPTHCSVNAH
jgi:hypothetical protein